MRAALIGLFGGIALGWLTLAQAAEIGPAPLPDGAFVRGEFQLDRYLAGFDTPLKSTGRFFVGPGRGLVWATEQPIAMTTVLDARGIRQIDATGTVIERNEQPAEMVGLVQSLSGLMAGDFDSLKESFSVKIEPRDDDGWRAVLSPKDAVVASQLLSITAEGRKFVTAITVTKAGDDFDEIRLTGHETGQGAVPPEISSLLE